MNSDELFEIAFCKGKHEINGDVAQGAHGIRKGRDEQHGLRARPYYPARVYGAFLQAHGGRTFQEGRAAVVAGTALDPARRTEKGNSGKGIKKGRELSRLFFILCRDFRKASLGYLLASCRILPPSFRTGSVTP